MIRLYEELLVVDASAILEVLLRTPAASSIERRIFADRVSLNVPELFDVEVAQVLRRYVQRGVMKADRAARSLELLADLPIARHPHLPFVSRIWALRDNLTAYDAAYVALAEGLGGTLLTRDERLAAAPGNSASIEVL